ncbi:glycosyltransferase family 4 protein [Nocardioides agariphilus]|uniref:Glycosyltransferase family 4 protein n=1 Tax=Nocardioides agariphilus TaxID=433664 RepID=A0A930VH56_9ACTN|nr:glycosyltransferase family 4 protein [Nocardioides agariphilus]MBF4767464.1 glycosyltransferase family 4 protein [Nocardioides agariphilus]
MRVHLVGPVGLSDPARPSGGNVYDLRVAAALRARGHEVAVHETTVEDLSSLLGSLPEGAPVVIDGLVGSTSPHALARAGDRLRLVMLVHLPLGLGVAGSMPQRDPEARALAAVSAVVCTSGWTRDWLAGEYGLPSARLHVVVPGADKSPLAEGSATGERLLSVGAVTPVKGHDVLVAALASLIDLRWTWSLVGASVDADHATRLWSSLWRSGLDDRVTLAGALTGADLASAYAGADLLVLPSRHETYGIVASEALSRGIPVLATDVGGVREALGSASGTEVPGFLVPSNDPVALGAALRSWLTSPPLRTRLRSVAVERRDGLAGWDVAAASLERVLAGLSSH